MTGAERCRQYVDEVLSGVILAPQSVALACKRFNKDLKRKRLVFDEEAANKAVFLIETMPHTRGKWAAKKMLLTLEPWQCFLVCNLFGWKVKKTGLRRFRYAYVRVPRKNGKSLLAASIGLVFLTDTDDYGAEVYCGATNEKQAWEVFKPAKVICEKLPKFRKFFGVEVNAKSIICPDDYSKFEPVIGKPGDGPSPSLAIVDEYHEHADSGQYDTFDTGTDARDQSLLFVITTSGSNLGGPCKEYDEECDRILDGSEEDDATFVLVYRMDEGDVWDDPEVLRKVNPNFGISANADSLLHKQKQARKSARKQNAFRTKHLNEWVGARVVWMNQLAWQAQARKKLTIEDFAGLPCYLTVDLNTKTDLAALGIVFRVDGEYTAFAKHYAPEDTIAENDKYRQFELDAALTSTPGNVTDYAFIEHDIEQLAEQFDVLGLGYDPWQANYLATRLQEKGLEVFEYRHTVANMSEPMKELEALVLQKKYHHNGDPVLSWCMANVMARKDEKENIYPVKDNKDSPNKIDGAVAAIMGVGMWIKHGDDNAGLDDFLGDPVVIG